MGIREFINFVIGFIDGTLVPFIFSITFVVFIWGMFQYFIAGGADEEKRKQGRTLALWGIIGFAIMISIWGIVSLVVNTLGFQGASRPNLPHFNSGQQQQQQQQRSQVFTPTSNAGSDNNGNGNARSSNVAPDAQGNEFTTVTCDPDNPVCPNGQRCVPAITDGSVREYVCAP